MEVATYLIEGEVATYLIEGIVRVRVSPRQRGAPAEDRSGVLTLILPA
jgi:hypothetical protein